MKRVPLIYRGVNPEIAAMWESLDDGMIRSLKALSDVEPVGLISASTNFTEGRLEVPASTWAVFESVGPFPETLQNIWGRIYAEWFPSSGYELAAGPEILWNENKDVGSPAFRSEIWIPVAKRKMPAPPAASG